jgi:hypothetical protein
LVKEEDIALRWWKGHCIMLRPSMRSDIHAGRVMLQSPSAARFIPLKSVISTKLQSPRTQMGKH